MEAESAERVSAMGGWNKKYKHVIIDDKFILLCFCLLPASDALEASILPVPSEILQRFYLLF